MAKKIYVPPPPPKPKSSVGVYLLLIVLGFVLVGNFRIYNGEHIGIRVVQKRSFSFTDTYVNIDDLIGMPRIAVASQHPAVKKQMEDMGWLETDEQVKERIQKEYEEEYKKQYKKVMDSLGY